MIGHVVAGGHAGVDQVEAVAEGSLLLQQPVQHWLQQQVVQQRGRVGAGFRRHSQGLPVAEGIGHPPEQATTKDTTQTT